MFAFYPFHNKEHLKSPPFSGAYYRKLQELGVMEIVCRNKTLIEQYGEMVDQALLNLRSDLKNADAFSRQENDKVEEELATVVNDILDEQEKRMKWFQWRKIHRFQPILLLF